MGWRDRDYAKFREDELDALLGGSGGGGRYGTNTRRGAAPHGVGPLPRTRRRRRFWSGVLRGSKLLVTAVAGTVALLALAVATGRVDHLSPLGNRGTAPTVIVPQVRLPLPRAVPSPHRTTRIAGTRLLRYGGTLTLSDSHTPMTGNIVVSGRWGSGAWETFAVARGADATFSFRITLTRRGVLHLRISYPDGGRAVGTYDVQ